MKKSTIEQIITEKAPAGVAAYSQGLIIPSGCKTIITSGQIALNPQTKKIVSGGITTQTKRVLQNIDAILEAGGMVHGKKGMIISVNVLLTQVSDFALFNEVYAKWVTVQTPLPTRFTAVGEIVIPKALVEISCTAILPGEK